MRTIARRLRTGAALVTLGLTLLLAPGAHSGEYTVDACQTTSGERMLRTGGWQPQSGEALQTCEFATANYPALYGTWREAGVHLAFRGWTFVAPTGTSIVGYELHRWYAGHASGGVRWAVVADGLDREACGPPSCTELGSPFLPQLSPANRVAAEGVDVTRLVAGLSCVAPEGCPAPGLPVPRFNVMAARVRLADDIPPQFLEPPSGSLLSSVDTLTGEKSVTFPVADGGSGLAVIGLRIDGGDYALQPVDPDHPTCSAPYPVALPCPLRHRVTLLFDTATLPNGPHSVRVLLRDAAGNETVSDPYAVVTRNGSQPNGRNAGPLARLRAWLPAHGRRLATRRIGFRQRAAVAGRLVNQAGRPITRAILDVFTKLDSAGAAWKRAGSVATDGRGRFRRAMRIGPSRRVRIAYRAYTLDPGYTTVADVRLRVRTSVRFGASPLRVRNGSWITFRGRLRGQPGRRGVTVVIYAVGRRMRGERARVPVEAVRTDRAGRFRYRYQFRKIAGPFHYRFQARTRSDRGYPYAPGRSRIVHVSARP